MTNANDIARMMRTARGIALLATAGFVPCAESQTQELRFEVASVKRSDPASPNGGISGGPGTSSPVRFTARSEYFGLLALRAYGLELGFQVECKLPGMLEERYDVVANVAPGTTREEIRFMLQRLLQDRLGLVAHRETKLMHGYRLVVAKDGAKLTKAAAAPESSHDGPSVVVRGGVPGFSKSAPSGELMTRDGIILRGRSETLKGLARWLSLRLKVPIIDATGLEGEYDYSLTYTPDTDVIGAGPSHFVVGGPIPVQESAEAATPNSRPPLWEAIQWQLGLKLEPVKDLPVEVVVIDKANKVPIEN